MHKIESLRILVITSTFPRWQEDIEPGFVYDLCLHLKQVGFEIDVLAPQTSGAKSYEVINGIGIYRYQYFIKRWQTLAYEGGIPAKLARNRLLYFIVPFFLLFQAYALLKQIKKKEYDAIHAHWLIPQGFICAVLSKFLGKVMPPVLCTSHGSDLFSLQSFLLTKIKKWTIQTCQKTTVVSESMRRYCLELSIDPEKIAVCSMGVDLKEQFRPIENIQRQTYRIVYIGRLIKQKGVVHLLGGVRKLIKEFPDIELLIVGDGPELVTLKDKVDSLAISKHINFYGALPQQELPTILSSATIAVVPSISQEGLGLATIEAMGCGCVVVASSVGGIKDVVEDGKTGVLVRPGDSEAIADAIRALLTDKPLRLRLMKVGRQSVLEKYDWRSVTERYQTILDDLVEKDESLINQ